jgi:penicillin-binding protein 1C
MEDHDRFGCASPSPQPSPQGESEQGWSSRLKGAATRLTRRVPSFSARGTRGAMHRMRGAARVVLASGLAVTALSLTALHWAVTHSQPLSVEGSGELSTTVLDRNDRLLRAFTTTSGHWRLPVTPETVDQRYLAMLLAFEDRRFYRHAGLDPQAFVRAAGQMLRYRRIVSGASTLTMQVARLLEGPQRKSGATKLRQIVHAIQLERTHSKAEILAIYLKHAPFGGNMEGVRAASLAYFGKEPKRLSVGEAALLVAVPQSPETRRPDRAPATAKRARDRVLSVAQFRGVITRAEMTRAQAEPIPTVRREFPKFAPHLAEAERARAPQLSVHKTTLDRDLQSSLELLARDHIKTLGDKLSAAILVADHKTGEVLAHVGSAGYLDDTRFGAIDMVNAVRSPGSTLKPFIYGLGFEAGLAHPETLIEDRPVRFGTYTPKNFDEEFHGTVTIREALAQSLNIPAVKVLNVVGPGKLYGRLKRAGLNPVLPAKTEPTIAIALGGVGLTLHDLATGYAGLARGGDPIPLVHVRSGLSPAIGAAMRAVAEHTSLRRRLLSPVAAWYVTDILKDAPPPVSARGGRLAYKTGTSYGYRDAYAIGYDGQHTIAVWVGRPDSAATAGLTGRTSAAPLLFDAFARLGENRVPLAGPPSGAVIATGASLPPPLKRFKESSDDVAHAGPFLEPAPLIAFPPDRSELEVASDEGDTVVIKADGGALPLTWLVDGQPIPSDPNRRDATWHPNGRGFAKLSVIDAQGKVDRVTVRLR